MKTSLCFALCCLIAGSAPAQPLSNTQTVKRLYIEAFSVKTGSEKLRDDLVAQVRKLSPVSIVADRGQADAILVGSGEIWIKGYQSLNPRSGHAPANGTPVFAGFVSVELKDPRGETLWSDMVNTTSAQEDIAKDFSRRIAKHLAAALEHPTSALPGVSRDQDATLLTGAGATFPAPVYEKWFASYGLRNPKVHITYEAAGSEAGIRKLLAGGVDFGASDSPEAVHDIAPADEDKFVWIASVVGAVVPVVNLPGLTGDISFTPEALAGIYLGKITKWNDPALRAANPRLALPNLDIVVIHRADGSGTSYTWTDYLSRTSAVWKEQVGTGLAPKWPVGRGAPGNDGVAKLVKELGGSIGYVEYIYALRNHVTYGKVKNRRGEFVNADLESIAAAANDPGTKRSLVDSDAPGAYPLTSFTWMVVPLRLPEARRTAMTGFLEWMLGPGQREAASLGYLALPGTVVEDARAAVSRLR